MGTKKRSTKKSGQRLIIYGAARSGTTLLINFVNLCDQCFILNESNVYHTYLFPGFRKNFHAASAEADRTPVKGKYIPNIVSDDATGKEVLEALNEYYRVVGEKFALGPSSQGQDYFIEEIAREAFDATFVLTLREPASNLISMRKMFPDVSDMDIYHAWALSLLNVLLMAFTFPKTYVVVHSHLSSDLLNRLAAELDISSRVHSSNAIGGVHINTPSLPQFQREQVAETCEPGTVEEVAVPELAKPAQAELAAAEPTVAERHSILGQFWRAVREWFTKPATESAIQPNLLEEQDEVAIEEPSEEVFGEAIEVEEPAPEPYPPIIQDHIDLFNEMNELFADVSGCYNPDTFSVRYEPNLLGFVKDFIDRAQEFVIRTGGQQFLNSCGERPDHELKFICHEINSRFDLGDYSKNTLTLIRLLIERFPDYGQAYYFLALHQQMAKEQPDQVDEILENYQKAAALGFDSFWISYNRACLMLRLGRVADAETDTQVLRKLKPRSSEYKHLVQQLKFRGVNVE